MPTRKQKRRHQKQRRHEYEEVYVDADGNVVEVDDDAELPARPAATRNGRSAGATGRPQRSGAKPSLRAVQPPSLRRVAKRGAIFAPVMFILVSFLSPELSILQRVLNTLFLVVIFMPFSYLMDSLMYRVWLRRTGKAAPGAGRRTD